jgi:hypothetical protein
MGADLVHQPASEVFLNTLCSTQSYLIKHSACNYFTVTI